tara:strand:- start:2554 stop:2739 length:186 start_codon:yes stop_codon:yes gene_type:complete
MNQMTATGRFNLSSLRVSQSRISDAGDLISNIMDHINLLALNAPIEAARRRSGQRVCGCGI